MVPIAAALRGPLRRSFTSTGPMRLTLLTRQTQPLASYNRSRLTSRFSTQSPRRESQRNTETDKPSAEPKDNRSFQERYVAAMDDLGVSKNLRVVLLVVLSILGTMETWFWCKAIYVWSKGGKVDGDDGRAA